MNNKQIRFEPEGAVFAYEIPIHFDPATGRIEIGELTPSQEAATMPKNQQPPDDSLVHCRCGASFFWGRTAAGKAIPLNPRRLAIVDAVGVAHQGWESHFSTCPYARRFSRDRAAGTR